MGKATKRNQFVYFGCYLDGLPLAQDIFPWLKTACPHYIQFGLSRWRTIIGCWTNNPLVIDMVPSSNVMVILDDYSQRKLTQHPQWGTELHAGIKASWLMNIHDRPFSPEAWPLTTTWYWRAELKDGKGFRGKMDAANFVEVQRKLARHWPKDKRNRLFASIDCTRTPPFGRFMDFQEVGSPSEVLRR